ncbi:hypothetical protein [Niabella hibiscisoli]|uniref:hypothetical protein n=1 Tax=Niabella hibiscisoli TaxID=1825928 RepID=UPI001F0F8A7E|nr:hypothetical protein [Niabella hibiscisoli]MCH5718218.1 hypothetical protein [Niabella hibiscisoli]
MNQRKLPLLAVALTAITGLINTSSVNAQDVTYYGASTALQVPATAILVMKQEKLRATPLIITF